MRPHLRHQILSIAIYLTWAVFAQLHAQEQQDPKPQAEVHIVPTPNEGKLVLLRYPPKTAKPGSQTQDRPVVLLIHGMAEDRYAFKSIGHRLHQDGADVWMASLPGHGNGDLHQELFEKETAHYLKYTASKIIPEYVNYLVDRYKKPIVLGGHSEGGMAAIQYVAGISSKPGEAYDEKLAREIASTKVAQTITIGSPFSFENIPTEFHYAARAGSPLLKQLPNELPTTSADENPLTPKNKGLFQRSKDLIFFLGDEVSQHLIPSWFLNTSNLTKSERIKLFQKGLSHSAPKPMLLEGAHWAKKKKFESLDGFNYTRAFGHIHTPLLIIVGEKDRFTPKKDTIDAALTIAKSSPRVEFAVVPRTGHLDLTFGERAGKIVGGAIGAFINGTKAFGSPQKPLMLPDLKCSEETERLLGL